MKIFNKNNVYILYLFGLFVVAEPNINERILMLENDDTEYFVSSLLSLTGPTQINSNTAEKLLIIAKDDRQPYESESLIPYGVPVFWENYSTKGSLIVAKLADTIREMEEGVTKQQVLKTIRPFFLEGINGLLPAISPAEALECYYHCFFYPNSMNVQPVFSNDLEMMLNSLRKNLEHGNIQLQSYSKNLLLRSAYLLPSKRYEFIQYLESMVPDYDKGTVQPNIERILASHGEPLPMNDFNAIRSKSNEELLEKYLLYFNTDNNWKLNAITLHERLPKSANRKEMILKIFENSVLTKEKITFDLIGPTSQDASKVDKEIVDEILHLSRQYLLTSNRKINKKLVIETLRKLIISDKQRLIFPERGTKYEELQPYAYDLVVDLLNLSLSDADLQVRTDAMLVLDNISLARKDQKECSLER